jgi:hypothetical protein
MGLAAPTRANVVIKTANLGDIIVFISNILCFIKGTQDSSSVFS